MMHLFAGRTANEVWQKVATSYLTDTNWRREDGRAGATRELLHVGLSIADPRQRWVVSRTPALNPGFALAEVVWILAGRNDSRFLNAFFPGLPAFQGSGAKYHGAYGYRLRRHFGLDQLEEAYAVLRGNPTSRQVVLQIWDALADLPNEQGRARSEDIPCNLTAMLKVREGKLEWMQILRSNDIWRGLPHNIVQFTSLQEVLAGWLGLEVGSYNQISDSLHVYEADAHSMQLTMPIVPAENADSIAFPRETSDAVFQELATRVDGMIAEGVGPDDLLGFSTWPEAPKSIQNMLSIMGAELARRQTWCELSRKIASTCANPALEELWRRWSARNHREVGSCRADTRM